MSGEEPIGVNDELPDASLFRIELVPKWSEQMIHLLTTGSLNTHWGNHTRAKGFFRSLWMISTSVKKSVLLRE